MTKMSLEEYFNFDAATAPPPVISAVEGRLITDNPSQNKIAPKPVARKSRDSPDQCAQGKSTLLSFLDERSFQQHFQPGSTILLHGGPVDAIYLIESGTVRCSTIDTNGNRQIFAFRRKGGVVGLSDTDQWHFTAEAVDHVILKTIPRAVLEKELAVNIALRQEVRSYIRALLVDRERQLLTLVSSNGPERLYQFLQDFAASRADEGYVVLPMSRRDIGDHIGLSTESVSRAFSYLKRNRLIDLKSPEKYRIISKSADRAKPKPRPSHA